MKEKFPAKITSNEVTDEITYCKEQQRYFLLTGSKSSNY